jgi:uncharacterized membrane protein YoaK (UPF0700 family)
MGEVSPGAGVALVLVAGFPFAVAFGAFGIWFVGHQIGWWR